MTSSFSPFIVFTFGSTAIADNRYLESETNINFDHETSTLITYYVLKSKGVLKIWGLEQEQPVSIFGTLS